MYQYKVGGYFHGHSKPMIEGCTLNYDASGPMLVVALGGMTEKETERVRRGKIELALFEKDDIVFLMVKIPGALDWSDAPFHVGLYGDDRRVPEAIPDGGGWALIVMGVDAGDGKIKANRLIGLGTDFSRKMIALIQKQQGKKISHVDYHNRLNRIYKEYSCERMVNHAIATYRSVRTEE